MAKESIFKRWPWLAHVLAMIGISLVILFLVFTFIKLYARQGQEYELPDVVGMNIVELQADNPIKLDVVVLDSIFRPGQEGGLILTQDPKAGTLVKKGRKLYITMTAYSPDDAVLPELAGLTVRQAVSELLSEGLEVGTLKFVEDRYKNSVIDQTCDGKTIYAGQQIARGSVIDLTVGLGDSTGRSVVPQGTLQRGEAQGDCRSISPGARLQRSEQICLRHRGGVVVCGRRQDRCTEACARVQG